MQDLKVTIIQTALYWESIDENLEMFGQKTSQIEDETDLIVLPEMFNTGFTMSSEKLAEEMDGKTMQWMKNTAKAKNCVVVGSLIINENGNYYN
ncbi:MAG: nitrilase family protein, partial [Bacteroidetes bacterium]|nr:nitrilase family protein [Bacteroidota bacterium]